MSKATKQHIMLIDDDQDLLEEIADTLELAGHNVFSFARADLALPHITSQFNGVIVCDIRMPKMSGLELLEHAMQVDPELPIIMITGHGQVAEATMAMKAGAYDFLEKPVAPEQLLATLSRALEKRQLAQEVRALKGMVGDNDLATRLIGNSKKVTALREQVTTLTPLNVDLIVQGETGSGKDVVTRALHDLGPRAAGPFVAVNCAALPETLVDSAFFGHEKGAFTGADQSHVGYFEAAHGGTLFLDELESMPLNFQVRLLRVLENRETTRLGGNKNIKLDMRVIAAVKGELGQLVKAEKLRADLVFRLNIAAIDLPPLRARKNDVELLFMHFCERAAALHQCEVPRLDDKLRQNLTRYNWPGNVRELKNAAERFVIGLPLQWSADEPPSDIALLSGLPLDDAVNAFEKSYIEEALARHHGNVTQTAEALSIPRKKLYLRMKKYGLSKSIFDTNE
ncbi:sigma-54-dependent transcriptional regulator [Maritalea mediterranea]|uniref:Sigma-54 dependent transcriptional regulator n=1 Tax=Maritalea mediterranea TaxID=2909667 RepID=A0ABS9E6G2_9HYPH|nr:sigma-54 dependent transcriptional regulator [Maritalea mediterranea]MCF4097365.1 sigma-54 dependent transcriptional regulator [Maritalea mediterranea]